MKKFLNHALVLGGLYFAISFVLGFVENYINTIIIDILIGIVFVISFIGLCFTKSFKFIDRLQEKYTKLSCYLKTLGFNLYLYVPVLIFGGVEGYKTAMAAYNGEEYVSITAKYYDIGFYTFIAILIISLIVATYFAFFKKSPEPLTD